MIRRFLATLLLVADVALLVFFAIGYAARYLHPRLGWWAELVAPGLPYLSLLLIPALLFVGLGRRWVLVALHGVALVLALGRFVPFEGRGEAGPDDLVVLTYNTSHGGGVRADELGHAVTAVVRTEAPDLAAFQEASITFRSANPEIPPDVPLSGVLDSLGYQPVVPGEAEQVVTNPQPVLARGVELLEQTQTFLVHRLPGQTGTRVVRIRLRWQGREAVLYNLHLHSFGTDKPWDDQDNYLSLAFWRGFVRQYRQAYLIRAEEAAQIERMLAAETLPVLIVGDFNSTPHNWALARLLRGRQDAYKVGGRGWGATYHAGLPFVRIDHVLAGPEWEVVSAHVARARFSDHLPLIVRLRWKE